MSKHTSTDVDAVVIGAGFAGLYSVHRLRDKLGLSVQAFDAGRGPGGTWYWNRYPGARCDIESIHYSYSFDEDLQREWRWSERFAAQPEILSYLEHVADRFDLRRSYRFSTRVTSMTWDDDGQFWTVGTDDGATTTARFVMSCAGNVSQAKKPEFDGFENFAGEIYRTYDWPHEGVDLAGKRVGVIGTGSTGIQVIPIVAEEAAHLTVFQRTPNYAAPLQNRPTDPEETEAVIARYPELRREARSQYLGAVYEPAEPSALLATPEERRERYEHFWNAGGFRLVLSTYGDLLFNKEANDTAVEFIHEKIRERVEDPEVAEKLCPTDHPYATKRATFECNYYETFNRDDVELVDVRAAPIEEITPTGVRTAEATYDLDVIILATGFDAFTGALVQLGVTGRAGRKLADVFADGPRSYLGISIEGFPNLFTITGPQSAVGLYNNPLAIEDHVELASRMIQHLIDHDRSTIEPTPESQEIWNELVNGVADQTLLPLANSWYMGANIPGKPRQVLFFAGGAPLYRAITAEVEATGYGGFSIDGEGSGVPPMVRLDPAALLLIGAMIMQGATPLEDQSVEELRETLEGFVALQGPKAEVASVIDTTYPGPAGDRPARIFVPEGDGPFPVVVFLHPGGWVGGSIDVADGPCRRIAAESGAIVVAPSYRLAPEDPFPAAPDDCLAALRWAAETIGEHGGDPDRLVIAGESAGGNLAALVAQRARDEGGPALAAQVLLYPPIDPEATTESRVEFAAGPLLSAKAGDGMWAAYLAGGSADEAAPSRAASLEGLPPALVITAECDPMRDEGEDYGRALAAAGVDVEIVRADGMVHAAINLAGVVPNANGLFDAVSSYLRTRLQVAETAGV